MPDRRAIVTGIGVLAPNGIGVDDWWGATLAGRSGLRPISRFDVDKYALKVAGEITDFRPDDYMDQRIVVQTDRWTQLCLAAAVLALRDAGLDPASLDAGRAGVMTAVALGAVEFGQRQLQRLWGEGPIFIGAYQSVAGLHAAATGHLAIRYGLRGEAGVVMAEQAGGLAAVDEAAGAIRRGMAVMLAGSGEAPLAPFALAALQRTGLLSADSDPRFSYRPFDDRAAGHVPGEGGALLVIEELETARRRGARVYGEIAGYGATSDGTPSLRFDATGRSLARAIRLALDEAGATPADVDVVFADAFGSHERDAAEARALRDVFGERLATLPVTAPKTMTGRLYAPGPILDVAAALRTMRDGCIPPTVGTTRPSKSLGLALVRERPQPQNVDLALILARGVGGFNSAVVVTS